MAARRRAPPPVAPEDKAQAAVEIISKDHVAEDAPLVLAPPKIGLIFSLSASFYALFFYLVFRHYDIQTELRRSIAINTAMSFGGLLVVVWLIPVAARYLLKRNMFGYDINKKGTPQGTIKV